MKLTMVLMIPSLPVSVHASSLQDLCEVEASIQRLLELEMELKQKLAGGVERTGELQRMG